MSHKHLTLGEAEDGLEMLSDGCKASDTRATPRLRFKSIGTATDLENLALRFHMSLDIQQGVYLKLFLILHFILESLQYPSFHRHSELLAFEQRTALGRSISLEKEDDRLNRCFSCLD